jgi:hypothetical protein
MIFLSGLLIRSLATLSRAHKLLVACLSLSHAHTFLIALVSFRFVSLAPSRSDHLLINLDDSHKEEAYTDPILCPLKIEDRDFFLIRYLIAEKFNPAKAGVRIGETIKFRRQYNCKKLRESPIADFYNLPGAEMYLGSSIFKDKQGDPILFGRLQMCDSDNMHPWNHLQGGMYVWNE